MIEKILQELTEEFIQLWNDWEIDALGKFFKEDIEVYSPFISIVFPQNTDGRIKGKSDVLIYWRALKVMGYDKKFTQISFSREGHTVRTTFLINDGPEKMHTTYMYNEYGKMSELRFDYTNE